MKTTQKGFTLIELMIVIAIIAILAAIAIPAYQNYVIRAQVSEGMTLMDGAKTSVAEYFTNHGELPGSNASAGLAKNVSISGKYVSQVGVGTDNGSSLTKAGVIAAKFSNATGFEANKAINGKFLALSPITQAGSIKWTCSSAGTNLDPKYLPSSCR